MGLVLIKSILRGSQSNSIICPIIKWHSLKFNFSQYSSSECRLCRFAFMMEGQSVEIFLNYPLKFWQPYQCWTIREIILMGLFIFGWGVRGRVFSCFVSYRPLFLYKKYANKSVFSSHFSLSPLSAKTC